MIGTMCTSSFQRSFFVALTSHPPVSTTDTSREARSESTASAFSWAEAFGSIMSRELGMALSYELDLTKKHKKSCGHSSDSGFFFHGDLGMSRLLCVCFSLAKPPWRKFPSPTSWHNQPHWNRIHTLMLDSQQAAGERLEHTFLQSEYLQ